ncbi:MAG: hypothetical protein ACI8ZW_001656 [Yoonia sp.]|jgi:hypothetical protein
MGGQAMKWALIRNGFADPRRIRGVVGRLYVDVFVPLCFVRSGLEMSQR